MRNGESMVPSGRGPGSLEREIAHTRARMDSILSSLEATLTPGMLFDRAFEYLRNQELAKRAGKAAATTTWSQVKRNPIAFGIMGAGVAYWIFGGKDKDEHGTHRRSQGHPYDVDVYENQYVTGRPATMDVAGASYEEERGIRDRLSDRAETARARAREKAEDTRVRAHEAKSKVSSSVRGAASNVKARASGIASGAKTRAGDVGRSVRTTANKVATSGRSAASKAKHQATRAGSELSKQAREHPFLFAGIAMVAAAVAGSLLRPTRREDRLLGPQRDRLFERADEMGARGVERARDVANRAFEAAHEKVVATDETEVSEAIEAEVNEGGDGIRADSDLEATGTVPPSTSFGPGADSEIDSAGVTSTPPDVTRSDELRRE